MITNVEDLKKGAVISESSHYILKDIIGSTAILTHFESNSEIQIGTSYLSNYTNSADQYTTVVKVTKEDKKDGTPGIRTIFESIHSGQVFTVVFKKQDKPKSKKKLQDEIEALVNKFSEDIDKVKASKKGVADKAKQLINELIKEPILPYDEGEERTLRGFKLQFTSRDGKYKCMDMDIERSDKETGERLVNINTISCLIYDGVKYVVE